MLVAVAVALIGRHWSTSEFNTGTVSQAEVWIPSGVHELLKVHSAAYALLMASSDEIIPPGTVLYGSVVEDCLWFNFEFTDDARNFWLFAEE